MKVIEARNVNDAYAKGVALLREIGVREPSRAGEVLVAPCPVTTVYENPCERVLFNPQRDANPFFHLGEALHMMAGRNDATWLDRFVKDFSSRFAEDNGVQHGAYGFRWRWHFDMEGGGSVCLPDQLEAIITLLRANSNDRRVVLQMWDPVADLDVSKRDVPCNTQAYFRVRKGATYREFGVDPDPKNRNPDGSDYHIMDAVNKTPPVLDMTVCCRSNDIIWGAYGANAVHFSVLQEYMAARIGVGVGKYYQISNNFHAYIDMLEKVGMPNPFQPYVNQTFTPTKMVKTPEKWEADLAEFMKWSTVEEPDQEPCSYTFNPWFELTAEPFFVAHHFWRQKLRAEAMEVLENANGMSPDWRTAGLEWMRRRMAR